MAAVLNERPCGDCGAPVNGPSARYCHDCQVNRRAAGLRRSADRRRKFTPTETTDRIIREHYAKRCENGYAPRSLPPLREIGRRIGWPKHQVVRRAADLGLCRIKERPWSQEELTILERSSRFMPETIARRLRKAGFLRTKSAIKVKLTRSGIRGTHDFYSARKCAEFLGVDSHVILRWIKLGYLKAQHRGGEPHSARGDLWLINDEWVRRFVRSHPAEFDVRKVDQVWFLSMLFDGKVGFEAG